MLASYVSLALLVMAYSPGAVNAQRLYRDSDPVVQLDGSNFDSHVLNSSAAWVVEFYAAWCGHCQRFVPTWVAFARDIQAWSTVVKVGVVACNEPTNARICTQYNVRSFPTIKFFQPAQHTGSRYRLGRKYEGRKTTISLRQTTIDYLSLTQSSDQPPLVNIWPPLQFVVKEDLLSIRKAETLQSFVVVESNSDNYLGRTVILDTSAYYPNLLLTRLKQREGSKLGVSTFPALYRYWQDGDSVRMTHIEATNRADMVAYLNDVGRSLSDVMITDEQTTQPITYLQTSSLPIATAGPSDGLHMQDLESSLYYSLWIEIPNRASISGRSLNALKQHISILHKYHPGGSHVLNFLTKVNRFLADVENSIGGDEWRDQITALQDSEAYIPPRLLWTGCQGSRPVFRGYPCSLWMTFHALTVNAVDVAASAFRPQEVLSDMKNYIRYFMGCAECASHFARESKNLEQEVYTARDNILWLWNVHNRVNQRLHGDSSEDPGNPKFQFPREAACDNCWTDQTGSSGEFSIHLEWNEDFVLAYLRWFYRKSSIIMDAESYTFEDSFARSPTEPADDSVYSSTTTMTSPSPSTTLVSVPSSTEWSTVTSREKPETTPIPSSPEPCMSLQTEWSPCSASCGTGTSTRLSNQNTDCLTNMQVRLCNLRPCSTLSSMTRYYPSCPAEGVTFRIRAPSPLMYGNCRTVLPFYGEGASGSRICGICPGHCCYPSEEGTYEMEVDCGGVRGVALVQRITTCHCAVACPDHYDRWHAVGFN